MPYNGSMYATVVGVAVGLILRTTWGDGELASPGERPAICPTRCPPESRDYRQLRRDAPRRPLHPRPPQPGPGLGRRPQLPPGRHRFTVVLLIGELAFPATTQGEYSKAAVLLASLTSAASPHLASFISRNSDCRPVLESAVDQPARECRREMTALPSE